MKQHGVGVQGRERVEVHFFLSTLPGCLSCLPMCTFLAVPHCVRCTNQWPVKTAGPGGAELLQMFPSWCLTLPGAS